MNPAEIQALILQTDIFHFKLLSSPVSFAGITLSHEVKHCYQHFYDWIKQFPKFIKVFVKAAGRCVGFCQGTRNQSEM